MKGKFPLQIANICEAGFYGRKNYIKERCFNVLFRKKKWEKEAKNKNKKKITKNEQKNIKISLKCKAVEGIKENSNT